jgi:hypothetical protein
MKLGITRLVMAAAIVALMVVAGSTVARAQCTTASPNFTPDFSCSTPPVVLTLSGSAGLGPPASILEPEPPAGTVNPAQPATGVTQVLRLTTNSNDEAGSAWFNTQQSVVGPFSTTFTFQMSDAVPSSSGPADGVAFVIQNSAAGTSALGPDGCGIGFGGDTAISCTSGSGIPNSLAIELNAFYNAGIDPSSSDVAIQSCPMTGANSVDPSCTVAYGEGLAVNDLTKLQSPINIWDGYPHTVTVTYSGPTTTLLDVILDNNDLFPGGVLFNMANIGLNSGNAWVGFTAATGGGDDNQDILSWTFSPNTQSAVTTTGTTGVINLAGGTGTGNTGSDFNSILTSGGVTAATFSVNPIVMTQAACNKIVQKTFPLTQCIVYENTGLVNGKPVAGSVMDALTCPSLPGGTCGSANEQDFYALVGTDLQLLYSQNPGLQALVLTVGPYLGVLKGVGPNPLAPCAGLTEFSSNQIVGGSVGGDTLGTTKSMSGGGGSCWVVTYFTHGELPPGIKTTAPTSTAYNPSTYGTAVYACNNPTSSKSPSSPTGPYLTVAGCTQSQAPNPNGLKQTGCTPTAAGMTCTGQYDLSVKGTHVFQVEAVDSGGNINLNEIVYTVK